MLSIIIKEHQERPDHIKKMLTQINNLNMEKELLFVTSMDTCAFDRYNSSQYNYDIRIIPNIMSCGSAVNIGVESANTENVLILDSHVCCDNQNVKRLIDTLEEYPTCIITPGIRHVDFPDCESNNDGYVAHGGKIKISKDGFQWIWLDSKEKGAVPIPLACACAFMVKKNTFEKLKGIKFDFEEERSMRLWRLGHPTLCETRAVFGHWFRPAGLMSNTQKQNWFSERVASLYINVLEKDNWNKLERILSKSWGKLWYDGISYAKENYQRLRDEMVQNKDKMNENWFIEIED